MKLSKELIPIVLILATLVTINVFKRRSASARSSQVSNVKYTSYSAEEQGTKAFYLLLEKLGYKPKRLRMPYPDIRSEGLAVILAPDQPPIDGMEVEQLLGWVRQGNTLLFAPGRHGDQLSKSLGIELHPGQPLESSVAPFAFTALTAGMQRLVIRSGNRVLTKRIDAVQHFSDSKGGVVISFKEGEGVAVIISDPYLMTNAGLPKGDNLNLFVNILLSCANDAKTVYFDEYHHGFESRRTVLHLLKGTSLSLALFQIAAAIALLMYSRGHRFGLSRIILKETHRSSVEYVTSLAGIYRNAKASDIALANLYERFVNLMESSPHSESTRDLMDECRMKMEDNKINEKDLIDLSRRMELALHPREVK